MTTYAGVKAGWVIEVFTPLPEWEGIPVEQMFAAPLFDAWVPIDSLDPRPAYGWKYDGSTFTAPAGDEDAGALRDAIMAAYAAL